MIYTQISSADTKVLIVRCLTVFTAATAVIARHSRFLGSYDGYPYSYLSDGQDIFNNINANIKVLNLLSLRLLQLLRCLNNKNNCLIDCLAAFFAELFWPKNSLFYNFVLNTYKFTRWLQYLVDSSAAGARSAASLNIMQVSMMSNVFLPSRMNMCNLSAISAAYPVSVLIRAIICLWQQVVLAGSFCFGILDRITGKPCFCNIKLLPSSFFKLYFLALFSNWGPNHFICCCRRNLQFHSA